MPEKIDALIAAIRAKLPEKWDAMTPVLQLHYLLLSADEILKPPGNWILVDGDMTLRQILTENKQG